MKKRVGLLVMLLALTVMGFAMNVEAAEIIDRGYCGGEGDGTNLTWTLDRDGVLVIEGQGRMRDWTDSDLYNSDESPDFQRMDWFKYLDYDMRTNGVICSVIVKDGVKNIGDYAFPYCKNLSSIELPESLVSIGNGAFDQCTSIRSIDLPKSLLNIGEYAFYDCENLSSIVLPGSLMTIGYGIFAYCESLNNIVLPESLRTTGDGTFQFCKSLSSIVLPESLTSIGEVAFQGCESLSSISLPESLISIGYLAFNGCTSLSSIDLPQSLTIIGDQAFYDCPSLSSIYIPLSVVAIGDGAFGGDVYYGGTIAQWNNMDIGDIYATIHYVDYDYEKLNAFVSRLYRNFLKREPDEEGLVDWIYALESGRGTGAKVVAGFVLSPEYQANSLSNEEYVTALYQIIFDREPDAAGLNAWVAAMENGHSYKKVLAGFVNSDEFENLCRDLGIVRGIYKPDDTIDKSNKIAAFVARLYKVCLGREYDYNGLDNWVRALTSGTADVDSVVKEFFNGREFENRNLDDTEFVTVVYQTILDREPDVSGLKSWTDALAKGYTRNRILDGFLKSTEFGDLCAEYGIKR
jgi:hypothetical protein